MLILRSLLFKCYFYLWTGFSCIAMIPFLLVRPAISAKAGHFWATGIIIGLRVICGITYEERGKSNLPRTGGYILACKHQSAWDTIIFLKLLKAPCYILKKELLKLPLFGRYLRSMAMIAIDRSAGASALKDMLNQTIQRAHAGRPVIIFPEGTRTLPGKSVRYQPGIAMLYTHPAIEVPIIPVALNSGVFWNKKQFCYPKGTIVIEYLPPLPSGLDRKVFLAQLEKDVETHSNALMSEAMNYRNNS